MPYATISDQEIDPDSPVTTGLVAKLRDNPIAIANADAGAPRNKLSSLAEPPVHMFEAQSGQNTLTINPFATAPTNTMLLLISVQCNFSGESGAAGYSARIDGNQFEYVFVSADNRSATALKVLQQSNASHTVTVLVEGQQQNFSADCKITVTAFAA